MNNPSDRQREAAVDIARMVAKKLEKKPKPFRATKEQMKLARSEMDQMAESGDWSTAKGYHLVALYAWSHETIYGVFPSELEPKIWAIAATMASRMTETQFEGDYGAAVEFLRWVWNRERDREAWRREQGRSGQVIGWKLQFHASLITQYKIDCLRRK